MPDIIIPSIEKSLIEVQPFIYDVERESELSEERLMKCLEKMTIEIPSFEVIATEEIELVMVDCIESGVLMTMDDFVELENNYNSNIALIPQGEE